jgi:phage tail-like protein
MPTAARRDPFKNYSFLVEIDGIAAASFKTVSGLSAEVELLEYREGSDPVSSSRKLPGRIRYPNVTLRRGLTTSSDLWDWWTSVSEGGAYRRNVAIKLLDDSHTPVLSWRLRNAFPVKFELSELDASKNEVAIESIELAHEGLELDK